MCSSGAFRRRRGNLFAIRAIHALDRYEDAQATGRKRSQVPASAFRIELLEHGDRQAVDSGYLRLLGVLYIVQMAARIHLFREPSH